MFSLFKFGLRYGKKAVLLGEIALESLHLKHKSHHHGPAQVAKHLSYTTSENVFSKMKAQIVKLYTKDKNFIGSGVVFNNHLITHGISQQLQNDPIIIKILNSEAPENVVVEFLFRKGDDNINLYKLEHSINTFKENYKPVDLQKGEQVLVYSPLVEGNYTLQDVFVTKINQIDDKNDYIYHNASIVNNDSEFSDMVYDYQGNFQGIIPAQTNQIINANYLFGILSQYTHEGELRHPEPPFEVEESYSDAGSSFLVIRNVDQRKINDLYDYIDCKILEVNNVSVSNKKQLMKAIGYGRGNEISVKVQNLNNEERIFHTKLN